MLSLDIGLKSFGYKKKRFTKETTWVEKEQNIKDKGAVFIVRLLLQTLTNKKLLFIIIDNHRHKNPFKMNGRYL